MIQLLAAYPDDLIDQLVSPRYGIVTECEFLPTIAAIKAFLEERDMPRRAAEARAAAWNAPALEDQRAPASDEERAAQADRLRDLAKQIGRSRGELADEAKKARAEMFRRTQGPRGIGARTRPMEGMS